MASSNSASSYGQSEHPIPLFITMLLIAEQLLNVRGIFLVHDCRSIRHLLYRRCFLVRSRPKVAQSRVLSQKQAVVKAKSKSLVAGRAPRANASRAPTANVTTVQARVLARPGLRCVTGFTVESVDVVSH